MTTVATITWGAAMSKYAHLNLFVAGYGYHESAWKVSPNETKGLLGLDHFANVALAQSADSQIMSM